MNMNDTSHYGNVPDNVVEISKAVRNRMSSAVNIAKAMCSNGHTSYGRTQNFCFSYLHSKLVKIGMNDYRKIMSGYVPKLGTAYKKYGEVDYVPSLHAEIACLFKLGVDDCRDFDFFSIRIDRRGKCVHSKPCANCARILRQVGFKHVYFFDESMEVRSL